MKLTELENQQVEVVDIAENGRGVAKFGDLVVFVEGVVPGDVVKLTSIRKRRRFVEAKALEILKPSVYRKEIDCAHFGVCGGCKWRHLSYEAQLMFKKKTVVDALERIGGLEGVEVLDVIGSDSTDYYRNKLEYTFSDKRWLTDEDNSEADGFSANALGFHVPQRFDKILNINHCYLQPDPSNEIRNSLRQFVEENNISFYDLREHKGALRNLIIRTTTSGQVMVVVVFAYVKEKEIARVMNYLKDTFPVITSLMYIANQKKNDTIFDQDLVLFSGDDVIVDEMLGADKSSRLKFRIGAKSFYQTNAFQAEILYRKTWEFADFKGDELVYDLYTGAGTIANYVANSVRSVVGVEYVPEAIEDAKINSKLNGVDNARFFAGDMKDVLNAEFCEREGIPDVIIADPPRAGMHPDVVKRILEILPQKVVYVSCNVATQARDLAMMTHLYEVKKVQPVDMFPHTQHIENIVLLHKK